ncbi:MAG: hypothetical protein HDT46_07375 [Ruminococcaceae bacterium]|nr:hypothetical protein [Oscillospiraceae bacterium]
MKKIKSLSIAVISLFLAANLMTGCNSQPEIHEMIYFDENEQIRQPDDFGLKNVDFTDCTVDYVSEEGTLMFIIGHMSDKTVSEFTECLKEAVLEKKEIDENMLITGGGPSNFRITLNTAETMYIGFDDFWFPNDIIINWNVYKCDETSVKKLKGWVKEYQNKAVIDYETVE